MIDEILQYNQAFVENKGYEKYITSKYPNKKVAIVTCMDTRLTELLPAALGLKNGDAKIIKNAGGIISHPFGSAMRSLLIGIYELDVKEILVIGHTDCGAMYTDSKKMIEKMKAQGITEQSIDMIKYYGINFDAWLSGFMDLDVSVNKTVDMIKKHPLVPEEIKVYGLIIDSVTGELTKIA
ncbi:carbonic anhydrase [Anaerocolumna sp. AGMB13025]|uniref:beta-class carbonic anhydrase n=1 Tax=Anaerocolumna sp. AGMB13025 TaxID=3039116 RepID=UPI00241EF997|nr:carbonic anhydrase [Anaerocolumna sp. AGMB13025]WFR55755.1 carbonic anhydrase [Anaerocolumna sp. AGMB13025]